MNTIGKRVDAINPLFTQKVQDKYITRFASLPVNSRYIEGPPDLLWGSSFGYGNLPLLWDFLNRSRNISRFCSGRAGITGNWKPLRKITDQGWVIGRKEWAEVEFVPSQPFREKQMNSDRYWATRIRPAQGELFGDGTPYHYFAVVSNMWDWDGERLLR